MLDIITLSVGISACVVACAWLFWVGTRQLAHPAAAQLTAVFLLGSYAADGAWTAAAGRFGFDAKHWWWTGDSAFGEIAVATMLGAIFAGAAGLAILAARRENASTARQSHPAEHPPYATSTVTVALVSTAAISTGAIIAAYASAGPGLAALLSLIGYKQAVFAGKGYVLFLALLFKATVLLWTAAEIGHVRVRSRRFAAMGLCWVLAALLDLTTGTRSNLLFANIAIVLHLWHARRAPFPRRTFVLGVVVALSLALSIRVLTRDVLLNENRGRTPAQVLLESTRRTPDVVFFGELQSLDAQLLALTGVMGPAPQLGGRSLLAALTAPVPRSVFPSKGIGGNAAFTNWYFPSRYQTTRVEYAISIITELWLNGGFALVLLGGAAVGAYTAALSRYPVALGSPLRAVVVSLLTWRLLSLLRGDLFNWTINTSTVIVALILVDTLLRMRLNPAIAAKEPRSP